MKKVQTHLYRNFLRSPVKEPVLDSRQLTPEQILSLRYQCAVERGDSTEAAMLRKLIPSSQGNAPSVKAHQIKEDARRQADTLFKQETSGKSPAQQQRLRVRS